MRLLRHNTARNDKKRRSGAREENTMAKLIFDYPYMEKEYVLDENKAKIDVGRVNTNDIMIPDYKLFKAISPVAQRLLINDLTKVSRVHARLTFNKEDSNWYIEDIGTQGLGSHYGTYVSEARLEVKKPYPLDDKSKIRFGPVECVFSSE
jgi:pSer/pThr/pTyr-binding forkhead associated (FHA) protein